MPLADRLRRMGVDISPESLAGALADDAAQPSTAACSAATAACPTRAAGR